MIGRGKKVLVDALSHFNDDDGWAMASHVALSMILALFPFLIFATSLAGFLGYEAYSNQIVELVFEAWPDAVAEPIVREVHAVLTSRHTGFLSVGIVLAVFFASNGIEAIRSALSRAYRVTETRSFYICRLQSIVFVIGGAVMLFTVTFLIVNAFYLYAFSSRLLPIGLSVIALIFTVFACHAWLPAGRRRIVEIWPGILLTLVLWLAAAFLFAAYLQSFANYSATFAGLAGIMTSQIFLYLMAVILILGGELNAALFKHW